MRRRKPLKGGILEMIQNVVKKSQKKKEQPRDKQGKFTEETTKKPPIKVAFFILIFLLLHTIPGFEKVMNSSLQTAGKFARSGFETTWTQVQKQTSSEHSALINPLISVEVASAAMPNNSKQQEHVEEKHDTRVEDCEKSGGVPGVATDKFQCAARATEPK